MKQCILPTKRSGTAHLMFGSSLVRPSNHPHIQVSWIGHDLVFLGRQLLYVPIDPHHFALHPLALLTCEPDEEMACEIHFRRRRLAWSRIQHSVGFGWSSDESSPSSSGRTIPPSAAFLPISVAPTAPGCTLTTPDVRVLRCNALEELCLRYHSGAVAGEGRRRWVEAYSCSAESNKQWLCGIRIGFWAQVREESAGRVVAAAQVDLKGCPVVGRVRVCCSDQTMSPPCSQRCGQECRCLDHSVRRLWWRQKRSS